MRSVSAALLFVSVIFCEAGWAACSTAPGTPFSSGKTGELRLSSGSAYVNKVMYCGGGWQDLPGSPTATSCTKNGEFKLISGEMNYCNGSKYWLFDSSGVTNGSCSKSGEIHYNTGTNKLEFCNGSNWRVVSTTDTTADAYTFPTLNGTSWDAQAVDVEQVTGFVGGTGTFTFNTASCTTPSAKVCADSLCATVISFITASGTLTVPGGAYVRLGFMTPGLPSTTCSIQADIGGQSSTYSVTTAATDTTVAWASTFTEVRSAGQSTLITSNIAKTTSHSDVTISIADGGTGGSPEFRICADSVCSSVVQTWGSSPQTLSDNQYVQLRTTTGATNTDLKKVVVSAGTGANQTWHVMTSDCPRNATIASGGTLTCTCPAGYIAVVGGVRGGPGNYAQATSDFCGAAIHNGAVTNASGGSVTANGNTAGTPAGTCPSFTNGGLANGVTAAAQATSGTSMYFPPASDVCN